MMQMPQMMRKGRGIEATLCSSEAGGLIWIKGAAVGPYPSRNDQAI
jgi:hypothetical protein